MNKSLMTRRTMLPGLSRAWGPDVDQLSASIRRMFDDPFALATGFFTPPQPLGWMPAVEIGESEKELVVTAELPGAKLEDVHVSLENDVLVLRGEKSEAREEKDAEKQFHLVERQYGAFQRAFTLPCAVDPEKVSAKFDKGVLTITLAKAKAGPVRGREIAVTGA